MPTDEERSEVADGLRYVAEHGAPEWATTAYCIAECIGEDDYPLWDGSGSLFSRLADLIEPEERTCRNIATEKDKEWGSPFICSVCGAGPHDAESYFCGFSRREHDWSFCPNCGAKVVDE